MQVYIQNPNTHFKEDTFMADTMIRGMAANKQVRFFACNSTDTVEKARITHHTSPVVTNALGRLLTGGVLMGAMCKMIPTN